MQVTNFQVERSIAALRAAVDAAAAIQVDDRTPVVVSDELLGLLAELPTLREDRTRAGRSRLADGTLPSADELAEKLVGRLICDRLR
jgi:hypothetical protein